jgi:hypothetical protein
MWIRSIIANLVGIAVLLIGWAANSSLVLIVGFGILVLSLGYRITVQVGARSSKNR